MVLAALDHKIAATLFPATALGPKSWHATAQVLDALGSPFEWDVQQAGVAGVEVASDPLPAATLASIRQHRLALKGPLTTPVGGGFRSSNVRLREEFELFANVRPARALIPGRFDDIDLVLVRENLGGFYVAREYYVPIGNDPRAAAVSTGINTRDGSKRIARFAFEYALKHGRKKITIVHKANILKALSGLFLEATREVAAGCRPDAPAAVVRESAVGTNWTAPARAGTPPAGTPHSACRRRTAPLGTMPCTSGWCVSAEP